MVVLALLDEEPMHPYLMQHRIKERGKEQVANVAQPNSVYQAIDRLRREGLIAVKGTSRDERRPERTVYQITDEGRRTLRVWLRTMLSAPERDFPDFPAALSVMMRLEPDDVRRQLEARTAALTQRLEALEPSVPGLPRLFLIEDEYRRVVTEAELNWVRAVIEDLRAGRLTWSEEWLWGVAQTFDTPQPEAPNPNPAMRGAGGLRVR
jgi:DNA-binding PadR family transcriptional regulator